MTTRTVNGFTPEQEEQLLREVAWTKKYGKSYRTGKEALDDIHGEEL